MALTGAAVPQLPAVLALAVAPWVKPFGGVQPTSVALGFTVDGWYWQAGKTQWVAPVANAFAPG